MIDSFDTRIVDLTEDDAILPALEQDRRWAAYALCDLDPPYRGYARYIAAVRDGRAYAVVLIYTAPGFTALLPCGDHDGVRRIMAEAQNLPSTPFLLVRQPDLPAVEQRYGVDSAWTMLRLVVTARELRLSPRVQATLRPLSAADLPALRALYALWPETVFTPFMLEYGVYYGAFDGDALVAVAGTHAFAPARHIGAIGNVFTHPDHRGRGLAEATTGAVAAALVRDGAREVALNVREDNAPAIAAYSRLGFTLHEPYWEGYATLRA